MAVKILCGSCNGAGKLKLGILPLYKRCPKCNGQGRLKKAIMM